MKKVIATLALLSAAPALSQASTPYKLIITWPQGGLDHIDYPNYSRCNAAAKAIEAEALAREQRSRANIERAGGTPLGSPWIVYAFCIPG